MICNYEYIFMYHILLPTEEVPVYPLSDITFLMKISNEDFMSIVDR